MFGENFNWMENNRIIYDIKNNAEHIKELYFTGGEPFINKYHWELIDYLISKDLAKNIYLRYNTNGSVMKEEFVKNWKKFKRVQIGFSIDGINEIFEKIRTPLKWNKVKNNIILFDELINNLDNIESLLTPTISTLNVFHIPELINWFNNQNFKNIDNEITLNFVYSPSFYSIFNKTNFNEVFQLYKPHLDSFYGYFYKTILQLIDKEKYESIK
jgi:sulfatase maturation enzyme AslB (radical SAM superfamily)